MNEYIYDCPVCGTSDCLTEEAYEKYVESEDCNRFAAAKVREALERIERIPECQPGSQHSDAFLMVQEIAAIRREMGNKYVDVSYGGEKKKKYKEIKEFIDEKVLEYLDKIEISYIEENDRFGETKRLMDIGWNNAMEEISMQIITIREELEEHD